MLDISPGQEIYETSDVESEDLPQKSITTTDTSEEVYTDSLEPEASRKQFSKNILSTNADVDFSGSIISSLRTSGYSVSRVNETVAEKLSRIARELEEIKNEDVDNEQLNELIEKFHELRGNREARKQCQFQSLNLDSVFEEVAAKYKEESSDTSLKEITELESRVNTLETIVGSEAILEHEACPEKSIQQTLNDLERKISIINNPEYSFDTIKQQISELVQEAEKLELSKKLMLNLAPAAVQPEKQKESNKKIDELYKALPSLMENSSVIPLLVQRLKTLNSVHSEIDGSVKLAGSVDQVLNDITGDMKVWNESIDKLQSNLQEYRENVDSNVNNISDRIAKLTLKVDSLVVD